MLYTIHGFKLTSSRKAIHVKMNTEHVRALDNTHPCTLHLELNVYDFFTTSITHLK